jgi:hypothetical protein
MSNPSTDLSPVGEKFPMTMNRREALRRIALLMGGAMIGSQILLRGETLAGSKATAGFTDADRALLDEIGETIMPATDIPGAKAVHIGAFMTMMVTDCYNEKQHAAFQAGLGQIDQACRARYGKSFMDSTPAQRTELANALDAEQRAYNAKKAWGDTPHYFQMMKELTILGYFSSEIGCTQAVRYIEVPGAYHGDVPYKKGDPAWF